MLAGEAVAAIWNDIRPEGRAEFYDWHLREHIPERVGIPGFRRGRRFSAADSATQPEFFTLYEVDTMQVLQGQDYTARLNAPTEWTRRATRHFLNNSRGLARVVESSGEGMGGALLTLRFDAEPASRGAIAAAIRAVAGGPRICGAHLCIADAAASAIVTEEKRGRLDIQAPPRWFALVEATDAQALSALLPDAALHGAGVRGAILRGTYRLEHVRAKTAWTA
jgi:hypothetical protein